MTGFAHRVAFLLYVSLVLPLHAQERAETTQHCQAAPSVVAVGMTVENLAHSVSFFTDVLDFKKVDQTELRGQEFAALQGLSAAATARIARLQLGDEYLELTEYTSPKGKPFPIDSRSNDRWFQHIAIIVRDMEKAHALLDEKMVRHASRIPQRLPEWNKNAAGIKAFYFRDPDGHFLELLEFPPDKGDPKWHRKSEKLFLGIDHTAIVVNNTEASLHFYRDILGMKVVGASDNYGMEQEALNNIPDAHLRITTLRGASGPAIEFLEYLNPRSGRPYPPDAQSNDLVHWQTTLATSDLDLLVSALHPSATSFVSNDIVRFSLKQSDTQRAAIVRDPDRHALKLQAR